MDTNTATNQPVYSPLAFAIEPDLVSVGAAQAVDLPIDRLLAALICVKLDEKDKLYRTGILLHRVEDTVRMVSFDGSRLFVASWRPKGELPAWLDAGVIIPGDQLKARLGMIAKSPKDNPWVRITYAVNGAKIGVADRIGQNTFSLDPVKAKFRNYITTIEESAAGLEAGAIGDLHQIGFNPAWLKHVGEMSKVLGADCVVVYGKGSSDRPSLFTFHGAPGVILYMLSSEVTSMLATETAMILSPAIKGTLAALKAHVTRNIAWAEKATGQTKADFLTAAAEFKARIDSIMLRTAMPTALPAPQPDGAELTIEGSAAAPSAPASEPATVAAPAAKPRHEEADADAAEGRSMANGRAPCGPECVHEEGGVADDNLVVQMLRRGSDKPADEAKPEGEAEIVVLPSIASVGGLPDAKAEGNGELALGVPDAKAEGEAEAPISEAAKDVASATYDVEVARATGSDAPLKGPAKRPVGKFARKAAKLARRSGVAA